MGACAEAQERNLQKVLRVEGLSIEKSSGQKVKALQTDNGGEYTSTKFENYPESRKN